MMSEQNGPEREVDIELDIEGIGAVAYRMRGTVSDDAVEFLRSLDRRGSFLRPLPYHNLGEDEDWTGLGLERGSGTQMSADIVPHCNQCGVRLDGLSLHDPALHGQRVHTETAAQRGGESVAAAGGAAEADYLCTLLKLVESGELEPTAARIAVDAVRRNFGPDYPQPSHKP